MGSLLRVIRNSIGVGTVLTAASSMAALKAHKEVTPIIDMCNNEFESAAKHKVLMNAYGMGTVDMSSTEENPNLNMSNQIRRMFTSYIKENGDVIYVPKSSLTAIKEFAQFNDMKVLVPSKFIDENGNLICLNEEDTFTYFIVQKVDRDGETICMQHKYRFTITTGKGTIPFPCFYKIK